MSKQQKRRPKLDVHFLFEFYHEVHGQSKDDDAQGREEDTLSREFVSLEEPDFETLHPWSHGGRFSLWEFKGQRSD